MLKQGLNAVVMPLVLSLSEKVDGNGGVGVGIVEPKAVMNNVEKLKNCLRSLEIDSQSLGSVFGQIYHMLNKVIQQSINNCALCERVVSCYKAAIRNMRSDFSPFFPSLAQDLVLSFQKSRLPPFLYCASILVQEFKPINPEEAVISGSHGEVIVAMLGQMSHTFFNNFSNLELLNADPETVEEFYFLMAKAVQCCPLVFHKSQQGQNLVFEAAVAGLQIQHRDAHKGIVVFIQKLLKLALVDHNAHAPPQSQELTVQALAQNGPKLVAGLLGCLAGDVSAHVLGGRSVRVQRGGGYISILVSC